MHHSYEEADLFPYNMLFGIELVVKLCVTAIKFVVKHFAVIFRITYETINRVYMIR